MGAWVGAALTGLGALSGLFGTRKQVSDTTSSSKSAPEYDPRNLAFRDFLISRFMGDIEGAPDFESAYTTGGLRNIGRTNTLASENLENILTSRGLGRTTAGANALGGLGVYGANRTADFLNNIPIVMEQLRRERLGAAAAYQSSLPVGSTSSSQSHTVGNVGASSPLAGIIGGSTSALAGWLGQYAANKQFNEILKTLGKPPQPSMGDV